MSNQDYQKIKEVKAKVECFFCNGQGCYDCKQKGEWEEWVSLDTLITNIIIRYNKITSQMKGG